MCGRYVSPDEAAIERTWHIGRRNNAPLVRRFNVAPAAIVPVLALDRESGALELATARWGLVPHWWKNARPPHFSFNARIEEVAEKPMWRDALRCSRCLVPAEGWYEWREPDASVPSNAKSRRHKQPYFVRRRDRRLLAFAGLLSRWTNPQTGELLLTCSILTTAAKGALAAIHDRMPVVCPEAISSAWLDPAASGRAETRQLLATQNRVEQLECYAVSSRVNDARLDDSELIAPLPA